jgi:hypothetical protein
MAPKQPLLAGLCAAFFFAFASPSSGIAKPQDGAKKGAAAKDSKKTRPSQEAIPEPRPSNPPPEEPRVIQRGERVEFDGRLIQGQTAKAGAVYLFARVPTETRSMVKVRGSFREEIVRTVFLAPGRDDPSAPFFVPVEQSPAESPRSEPAKKRGSKGESSKKSASKKEVGF